MIPLDRAALLAALSGIVYLDWSEARLRCAELGVPILDTASHRDVECMLVMAERGALAAIVFRGTQFSSFHLRDMVNNFGWPKAWAGPGRVHSGYAAQLERIRDRAADFFGRVPSAVPLHVAGHSLGGALAGLFATWACGPGGGKVAGLSTFGAPKAATRAAWQPLTDKLASEIDVWQIRGEFAPYWPPSFVLCQPAAGRALKAPDRWDGPLRRHNVEDYATALARLAAAEKR